ncbi:DNA photolyase [bacterium]|nr:DNA photolyase [bacterium]
MIGAIRTIYVEKSVRDTQITRRVLSRAGDYVRVEHVDDPQSVLDRFDLRRGGHAPGKQALLLGDFRGDAIKPCPGMKGYLCCEYQILNFGTGCPIDCSYCILQDYFSNPLLVVQANPDAFLAAAAQTIRSQPDRFFRLGTGEFADSLALEPLTGYAPLLVEWVRDFPNAILELKSKATNIDSLLELDHQRRTVCAWSLNSEEITRNEEHKAAPLADRFAAARRCEAAGYRLAFHFDPIFHYPGWEQGYRDTINRVFQSVSAQNIAWISLGCFRYTPGLERTIRRRFPKNRCTYGEFIPSGDGKMRYPQPLRIQIYRKMVNWIREAGGENVRVYFCMENAKVWRDVMGVAPADNAELGSWLDAACRD